MEEVAVRAGHKVLLFDDNIFLIVGDPQGLLDQQLSPHPIHLLNIIIGLISYIEYILFNYA
jgi:hypothetical protein